MGFLSFLQPVWNVMNSFLMKSLSLFDEPHEKITANFILIVVFAGIYYAIYFFQHELRDKKVFYTPYSTKEMNFFDALYFSFVVHFTLGFGDIFPASSVSRIAVILHTTLFWFINLVDPGLVNHFAKGIVEIASKVSETVTGVPNTIA